MLKLIYQVFVPYAVQTFAKSEASRDIAELAANLCLNGDNVRDIAFNSKLLLKMFTDVNGVNMQLVWPQFVRFYVVVMHFCAFQKSGRIFSNYFNGRWRQFD